MLQNTQFRYELVFVYIAAIVGALLILIEPPMTCPDENVHFYNSYALSTGQIFPQNTDGVLTHAIPQNYIEFCEANNIKYCGKLAEKESFQELYLNSWLPVDNTETTDATYWAIDTNPVGYVVPAIGMAIFRLFLRKSQSVINLLMAGKFMNLCVYIVICYLAIKTIPRYKRTLFLLALMPMSLYQAASINYDALLISTCFALLAYVLSVLERKEDEKITKWDIAIVLGITVVLSGIKQIYAILLLILFAIPGKKFVSKKQHVECILSVLVVACVICVGYRWKISLLGASLTEKGEAMQQQLNYLFSHPTMICTIIKNSLLKNGEFYTTSFIGKLGQLDTNLPVMFLVVEGVALLAVIVYEWTENSKWNVQVSIYGLLSTALVFIMCFLALYVQWTSHMQGIGVDWVEGVQGRYFIPIAPFIVAAIPSFGSKKLEVINGNHAIINHITCVAGATSAIVTFFMLLLRYRV